MKILNASMILAIVALTVFSGCDTDGSTPENPLEGQSQAEDQASQDNGDDNVDDIFEDKDVQPPVIPTN